MSKSKFTIDNNLLQAILYIVVGLLFCIFRASALNWLLTIVGILFVVQGVLCLTRKDTVGGVVGLVIGLLLIFGGWFFVSFVMIVFGVLIIVKGVLDLMNAMKQKNNLLPLILAVLTIAVGVLLIVAQSLTLNWFFILLGIVFIVNGVLALVGKKNLKRMADRRGWRVPLGAPQV